MWSIDILCSVLKSVTLSQSRMTTLTIGNSFVGRKMPLSAISVQQTIVWSMVILGIYWFKILASIGIILLFVRAQKPYDIALKRVHYSWDTTLFKIYCPWTVYYSMSVLPNRAENLNFCISVSNTLQWMLLNRGRSSKPCSNQSNLAPFSIIVV